MSDKASEPVAKKKETILTKHGDTRADPYFWMRERDSKEVMNYLEEENEYLEKKLKSEKKIREDLFEEMKARIVKKDESAPCKRGSYFYYTKTEEDSNYEIYCRRKGSLSEKEEVLIDGNKLSKGHDFFDIGSCKASPQENLLAYSSDTKGRRIYNVSLKNLDTGKTTENLIENTTGELVWGKDNNTLFYTKKDLETLRSCELWRLDLKENKHTLLFEEKDETFSISIFKSQNKKYLFLECDSTMTSECHYLEFEENELKVFSERQRGLEYSVEDGGSGFFIHTNFKNKNFSLMETSYSETDQEFWKESFPTEKNIFLEDFEVFEKFIALRESHEGLLKIKIIDRATGKSFFLKTNDETYDIDFFVTDDFKGTKFSYTYESLTTPYSVLELDIETQETRIIKEEKVEGSFTPSDYVSKRVFATARDGEIIPISLVHRKDLKISKDTPLLQYAYGSLWNHHPSQL